jgi:16S rRNA (uracil1498-N3)-methyltransferase
MEPPIFYAPPIGPDDDIIRLPKEESHHLANVMRLKPSAIVVVVDGLGMACKGEVVEVGKSTSTVRVHSRQRNYGEPAVRLILAAGLSAGSKFDSVVQKGTELGVKRFVPVITEKSRVNIEDPKRARSRVVRLEKVALAAMKQCRRSYRPDIASPSSMREFLKETDHEAVNLMFHPTPKAKALEDIPLGPEVKRVTLLVGPEAGFSESEVEQAVEAGYQPVSLGSRVLRTETAGPVVCALVMQALGEFR